MTIVLYVLMIQSGTGTFQVYLNSYKYTNQCANPFGTHKKRVRKNLRPVTPEMMKTGLVTATRYTDVVCCNCADQLRKMTKGIKNQRKSMSTAKF